MTFADLDGDGVPDMIVGKRVFSHLESYTDPDPYGPAVLYWYRTVRNPKAEGGAEFVPELIHNRSGSWFSPGRSRSEPRWRGRYHYFDQSGRVHFLEQDAQGKSTGGPAKSKPFGPRRTIKTGNLYADCCDHPVVHLPPRPASCRSADGLANLRPRPRRTSIFPLEADRHKERRQACRSHGPSTRLPRCPHPREWRPSRRLAIARPRPRP